LEGWQLTTETEQLIFVDHEAPSAGYGPKELLKNTRRIFLSNSCTWRCKIMILLCSATHSLTQLNEVRKAITSIYRDLEKKAS
jgi:hypothetical protein